MVLWIQTKDTGLEDGGGILVHADWAEEFTQIAPITLILFNRFGMHRMLRIKRDWICEMARCDRLRRQRAGKMAR